MKLIGIVLIVFGIVALALGGINYTRQEKVLDVGPIHATAEKHERIPLPPLVGIVSLIAGGVVLAAGSRARS